MKFGDFVLFKFVILFVISCGQSAYSNERYTPVNEKTSGTQTDEENLLAKLLKNPEIKSIADECEKNQNDQTSIAECTWKKINDERPDLLTFVENEMEIEKGGKKEKKFNNLIVYQQERKKNNIIKELESFYEKRLNDILYGKDGSEKTQVTHNIYYSLAKAQTAKSIVMAISSYCIEADTKHQFRLVNNEEERKKIKKRNLSLLTEKSSSGADSKELTVGAFAPWNQCFLVIPHICYQSEITDKNLLESIPFLKDNPSIYADKDETDWAPVQIETASKKIENTDSDYPHTKYSRMRACEVVNYMEKSRAELIALEKIEKRMKEINKEKAVSIGLHTKNKFKDQSTVVKIYDSREKGKGIDDIVTVTSKEFYDSHNKGVTSELKEFEKCAAVDKESQELTGSNLKECERYLTKDKKTSQDFITENALRSKARGKHIKKALSDNNSDKKLEAILKEQGLKDEEIRKYMETSKEKLIAQIQDRYDKKNESLIDSMKFKERKISRISKEGVDLEKNPKENEKSDKEKLKNIYKELSESSKDLSELIHYNNIVSGYLGIETSDGKKKKNTNALKRELEGIALDKDGNEFLTNQEDLKKNIEATDILNSPGSDKSDGTGAEISVDNINEVLDYQITE